MQQDPSPPWTLQSACGLHESLKGPQALMFYVFPKARDSYSLSDQIPVEMRTQKEREPP